MMSNPMVKINNYLLYLLVFTVVFEQWDPFGFAGTQSITFFTSILYVLSSIPLLKYNFNFSFLKEYIFPLTLFVVVGIVSAALNSVYVDNLTEILKTRFFQLIILTILVANHISTNEKILWNTLNVYVFAVFLLYILTLMGIGISYEQGRIFIFGENPNAIGTKALMAFVIALGYLYKGKLSLPKIIILIISMIGSISLIILSGSRGALLFLLLGIIGLTLFSKIRIGRKIFLFGMGFVFIGFLLQYIFETNELFAERIFRSIESGETGRNGLWAAAVQIFEDNLIIGVGITKNSTVNEMFKYGGSYHYPHNIFLWVLMSTGIVGFIFFMTFIIRLGKNLVRSYQVSRNLLFIILFFLILSFLSKNGGAIRSMYGWLFFAISIGSTNISLNKKAV